MLLNYRKYFGRLPAKLNNEALVEWFMWRVAGISGVLRKINMITQTGPAQIKRILVPFIVKPIPELLFSIVVIKPLHNMEGIQCAPDRK